MKSLSLSTVRGVIVVVMFDMNLIVTLELLQSPAGRDRRDCGRAGVVFAAGCALRRLCWIEPRWGLCSCSLALEEQTLLAEGKAAEWIACCK